MTKPIPFWLAFLLAMAMTVVGGTVSLGILPTSPAIYGKLAVLIMMVLAWTNNMLGNPFVRSSGTVDTTTVVRQSIPGGSVTETQKTSTEVPTPKDGAA